MKKNFALIGIIIVIILAVGIFFYMQQSKKSGSGEYIPGTMCKVDSDCKFIKWTKDGQSGSICAVPDKYAKFFNVSIDVDDSKECYCMASYDLGPINVCTPK